jgi:hypothetical protein
LEGVIAAQRWQKERGCRDSEGVEIVRISLKCNIIQDMNFEMFQISEAIGIQLLSNAEQLQNTDPSTTQGREFVSNLTIERE